MCNKKNFYCFVHCCWFIAAGSPLPATANPSLPPTTGPSTPLTGPSNSSTGMDPFLGVWVRQEPSGTCFSYSVIPGLASAPVLPESSPLQLFWFFTDVCF